MAKKHPMGYPERAPRITPKHIGYSKLEKKIEKSERKAHPGYSEERISHVAHAAAGEIATAMKRRGF